MKKFIGFLLLFLPVGIGCRAQQITEKLKYELAESILRELPPAFVYAKRGADGKYHRQPAMVTDTPVVRRLLLDHPYYTNADYEIVMASEGTHERAQALKYFSAADLVYMRQQLPASKLFKFEQTKIQDPQVTVVALDTVMVLNKRLGWRARVLANESLLQRYGSSTTLAIGGLLFSKDHKRALVNVAGDGWTTSVYTKEGKAWRRVATLILVEY